MQRWIDRLIVPGLMVLIATLVALHPVATNDGPVHLAFSHLLTVLQQPDHFLQQRAYVVHLRPNPNLAAYLLMEVLLRVLSPGVTESIIQILCLAGLIAGGWWTLHTIDARNAWLAVFLLPLALNQMFYLGLYNHCLSTAAFFLAVGANYRMIKSPSLWRAAALSACLVLSFLCHASGFIMAYAGVGTISAAGLAFSMRRHRRVWTALNGQRFAVGAMLAPLPMAALFLMAGAKGETLYGDSIRARLKQFFTLQLLASNFHRDTYAAKALCWVLLAAFLLVSARILLRREAMPDQRRELAVATLAAALVSAAIMMAFPDTMGGGWTHFRRFEIYPYFWGLMMLAFCDFPVWIKRGLMAFGVAAGLFLTISMVMRQALIRQEMAPLATVDRLVGDHCTVLPIVPNKIPWGAVGKLVWIDYQPYYESASRLELTGDRVVLFNYLARLDVYPVSFRSNFEPQALIFHWTPQREKTTIETVDVDSFERSSGVKVDYILQWGVFDPAKAALLQQARHAVAPFRMIYKSPDGAVTLYWRQQGGNGFCVAPGGVPPASGANSGAF